MDYKLHLLNILCFEINAVWQVWFYSCPMSNHCCSSTNCYFSLFSAILKQGGSAVDAAISSLLCVGVVNPQSSGLGGGMFMLVYDKKSQKAETLMAREKAPAAATVNMYQNDATEQLRGKSSITDDKL